ncbi:glycosyltransferase [Bacillus sp. Bva_UNVM-123]|uniref:glycosyltransferase n=1 Tax=Bacillus sp. Bva_UNVM-123 TaxID=2829798 RepID=UPI00391F17B1
MIKRTIMFILISSLIVMSTPLMAKAEGENAKEPSITATHCNLKSDFQKLWIEHAWWTRNFIISSLAGIEDQNHVLNRLLQNQVDIGNMIKPYYGDEAGNKLAALLKEHILIAGKIVEAAKKGDKVSIEKLNKNWHRNADAIVSFLAAANPNWSKKELTDMFYTHLKFIIDQVVARLNKDWVNEIRVVDQNENHLIKLANILTDGIVKQFPEKFK